MPRAVSIYFLQILNVIVRKLKLGCAFVLVLAAVFVHLQGFGLYSVTAA